MNRQQRLQYLREHAAEYADLALENLDQEFPSYVLYVARGPEDLAPRRPRDVHPVFYGSFDWHSCVEMYWLLARLLRLNEDAVDGDRILSAWSRHLTPEAVAGEVAFFTDPHHHAVERPYGWGWLLSLADELERLGTPEARQFGHILSPLTQLLEARFEEWLKTARHPVRSGLHGNSAFGVRLALAWAARRASHGVTGLENAMHDAGLRWFGKDREYPVAWEPSGSDFLSPCLTEAELMSHILSPREFVGWFDQLLPSPGPDAAHFPWEPLHVGPNPGGQESHLLGLNLSRAWALNQLVGHLPPDDARQAVYRRAAAQHAERSLDRIHDGYMTSHWLSVYAVLYLSE